MFFNLWTRMRQVYYPNWFNKNHSKFITNNYKKSKIYVITTLYGSWKKNKNKKIGHVIIELNGMVMCNPCDIGIQSSSWKSS